MPKIQPFRGLRYNLARVGALTDVVAPPYDVVDAPLFADLQNRSPYNIIRVELPNFDSTVMAGTKSAAPDLESGEAGYSVAATLLRQWCREGILQREPDAALYVYHQTFELFGMEITRRGFFARVRLERFGEGNIYPHEQTHPKAKLDRLKLLRQCETNVSPIFGLYPDASNSIQNLLEAEVAGTAGLSAKDHLGVTHIMWPIVNQSLIQEVACRVETLPMFIADGHHRYETACTYRDELAAQGDLPDHHAANFVLTAMMSMDDPGLIVLPTHRVFSGVSGFSALHLKQRVEPYYDCQPCGPGDDGANEAWKQIEEINDQGAMAIYTGQDNQWTLLTANQSAMNHFATIATEHSLAWRSLGVSMLHHHVMDVLLKDYFNRGAETPASYFHSLDETKVAIRTRASSDDPVQAAALVMPAAVDDLRRVSLGGERMPAKSTYFYPKLLTGLVLNPFSN